jgi:hypothetical protein
MGLSLGIGLVLTYFFGFIVGLAMNIIIFVGVMFYIRWRQKKALESLGFSDETAGAGYNNGRINLRYECLSCGAQVSGTRCKKCGSSMKKPLF